MKLKIYADGGAKGNPGPAGIGVVIYDDKGELLEEISRYLGKRTNNQAEYEAVYIALKSALKYKPERVDMFLDSELAVNQLSGIYKVKNQGIKNLFEKVKKLTRKFDLVDFHHVRRNSNKKADQLVNRAINLGS